MYLVAGHDSSIVGTELYFQKEFGVKDYYHPFYASNIRFEMYKDNSANSEEAYYVKYFFQEKEIAKWNYTYFKNKLESTLFSEEKIAKYCDFQSYGNTLLLIALIVISVFCVLIIIGLIVIVITQRKKMKENNNNGVKDLKSEAIMPKDEL